MLRGKDFDLGNPTVVLHIMTGLFYIPHAVFKIIVFSASLAAFQKMGFSPPCKSEALAAPVV
jgi:hypothetical protein